MFLKVYSQIEAHEMQQNYHFYLTAYFQEAVLVLVTDNQWPDKILVSIGRGDTAAYGAMAYALNSIQEMDNQALFDFWSWWLTEALRQAYDQTINQQSNQS